jgi:hypothetical protein
MFLLCYQVAKAQDDFPVEKIDHVTKDSTYTVNALKVDDSKINLRSFDTTVVENYRKNPQYEYEKEIPKNISFWDRLKAWLLQKLLFAKWSEQDGNYFKYTFYAFAALLATWAIIKLMGMDIFGGFYTKDAAKTSTKGEWLEDNIHEIDFEKEIENAINKENYKVAVRLFYLFTLKKLSDKSLIQWEINKTNHDYSHELLKTTKGQQLKQEFDQATYYFEYVWYGDFKVDFRQFEEAKQLYRQFIGRI